jgi:flagellin-like hook-associated protein FlgL
LRVTSRGLGDVYKRQRYNILVQAGTAMLAQANTAPQSALRLLQ